MPKKWILEATSRSGEPVNQTTGASSDSIAVYGKDDLDARLKAAAVDPRDLAVTVREVS